MQFDLAVLLGDGVGPEVAGEAIKVLQAVGERYGHSFNLHHGLVGGVAIDETGTALPDDALKMCKSSDAVLLGAVGGPKWDDPQAEVRPEDGLLALRKELGLFANLRPVMVFPMVWVHERRSGQKVISFGVVSSRFFGIIRLMAISTLLPGGPLYSISLTLKCRYLELLSIW